MYSLLLIFPFPWLCDIHSWSFVDWKENCNFWAQKSSNRFSRGFLNRRRELLKWITTKIAFKFKDNVLKYLIYFCTLMPVVTLLSAWGFFLFFFLSKTPKVKKWKNNSRLLEFLFDLEFVVQFHWQKFSGIFSVDIFSNFFSFITSFYSF
jgi:hypothetical protein